MKTNKYYVYGCYVEGELKYVGLGHGTRYKHCTSGTSSCSELNRDFHQGKEMIVKKLQTDLSKEEAQHVEETLIKQNLESLYNKVVRTTYKDIPDIKRKQSVTILGSSHSVDEKECAAFEKAVVGSGLSREMFNHLDCMLCDERLALYAVKVGQSKPMLVIDKVDDRAMERYLANCFSHLAHPEGDYSWHKGMDMEFESY